jgi:hypothetical protein
VAVESGSDFNDKGQWCLLLLVDKAKRLSSCCMYSALQSGVLLGARTLIGVCPVSVFEHSHIYYVVDFFLSCVSSFLFHSLSLHNV